MKKYLFIILFAVFGTFFATLASASTIISFTPVSVSARQGQAFTIAIGVNPQGVKNYTVKLELDYPADLLEVGSFVFAGTWMPLSQSGYDLIDNTNGVLIKTAGYPGGLSSATTFGTVSFYAKKSGSGIINLDSSSFALDANNQNVLASSSVQTAVAISSSDIPTCIYTYSSWSQCSSSGTQARTVTSSSPSGCQGSPVTSQSCAYQAPACTAGDWQSTLVPSICPSAGQQTKTWTKIGTCDSTTGVTHPATEIVSCTYQAPTCIYTYSSWSQCSASGTQARTVTSSSPSGCQGNPSISQSCVPVCVAGDWQATLVPSICPSAGKQTKTWTKIRTCGGGAVKPADQEITCSYQIPQCTEGDWQATLVPADCPSAGKQTKYWAQINNCEGGVIKVESEEVACEAVKQEFNYKPLILISTAVALALVFVVIIFQFII